MLSFPYRTKVLQGGKIGHAVREPEGGPRFRSDAGNRTKLNNKTVDMAVIYNDKVCIYANELIMYDPKRKVGSEKGFLPRGTYDSKVNRKQIIIARRSIPNSPALVEFDSLEVYIQQLYP